MLKLKKRGGKVVAYLLAFVLAIGIIPNSPLTGLKTYAAQTTVLDEDFSGISSWGTEFPKESGFSIVKEDTNLGIKGSKIVSDDKTGGIQFRTDKAIGLLNTSKMVPGFDIQVNVTTGQALQIDFDWKELKNLPSDATKGPRECKLNVFYSFEEDNFKDLAKDQAPKSLNSDDLAQSGKLSLVIPKEEVTSDKLYLRIFSLEGKNGGGNRPGFILDNFKIISTDENLKPEEDKAPPKIEELCPKKDANNVRLNGEISIAFDEEISFDKNGIRLEQDGKEITIKCSIDSKKLIIKPEEKLVYDNMYTVTVSKGAVKDLMGNSYPETITWSFTTEKEAETISILQARKAAKGETVQVQGTVVAVDSNNFFVQDDTAGIVARGNAKLQVGNIVQVKGPRDTFNGLEQISSKNFDDVTITVIDNNINELPEPIALTIPGFKDDYQSQRIKLEGVTLGKTEKGNTILVDGEGNETIIRNMPKLSDVAEGDLVTVIGVLSKFTNFQLFVADAKDIQKDTSPDTVPPTITHEPVTVASIFKELIIPATVKDNRKVETVKLYYKVKDAAMYASVEMEKNPQGIYEGIVPKINLDVKGMLYYIEATDGTNVVTYPENKELPLEVKISNEDGKGPEITKLYPQDKQKVVNNVMPKIGVEYTDETGLDKEKVKLIVDEQDVTEKLVIEEGKVTYAPIAPLTYGEHKAKIELVDSSKLANKTEKEWTFIVSDEKYSIYFGQLHSHTAENSDGAGTLAEAYEWAREKGKLDFFAVTDHSNSFDEASKDDKADTYNLEDYNKNNQKWQNGLNAAKDACTPDFLGIYGYEMTWSGGPGHMNTFNTEGFVSRNNKELNNKTNDAGLRAYYALLKKYPDSISQFNHPGKTFGTFSNFSYYDPIIDERINLVEVGNGEGAIGSGGYFRSYEEYDKALDKGWHLAPTNNQDNHKKGWGTANTARTVIYTTDLSRDGLYDALHNRRVYATEDNNLSITYTLNDEVLGSVIDKVPSKANFKVEISDPDETDQIASIAIISNGGKEVYKQKCSEKDVTLDYQMLDPKPGHYYIKVVEADGDIAVTAPIWLGKAAAVGISEVNVSTFMPVTNEELTLTTELFNNEESKVIVKNIRYDIKGGKNIADFSPDETIKSSSTYTHTQAFMPTKEGTEVILITVEIEVNGVSKTYTSEVELKVRDSEKLIYLGIDASHYNEYVNGNYKDSMGNFGKLAADYNARTVELKTGEDLLEALKNPKYQMMVFTVPSRRDGTTGRVPYATYSDEEIAAIANFAKSGKTVIIAGWGDYYENYSNVKDDGLDRHMAGQQNKLLKAIGSSLRISDDGVLDDVNNGGQAPRLYLTDYNNFVNPLTKGIVKGQVYSNYGGSTIYAVDEAEMPVSTLPTSVLPIISGHETTYSKDQDGDGFGPNLTAVPKYNDRLLITASEVVAQEAGINSQVIVSGAAFMSNFEIQATMENAGTLNYSNYNILENIIAGINPIEISSIADVKEASEGTEFTIQGIATSSVYSGSDDNKGFFDCIYVQDATGGINLFPVAQGVEAGQTIRVTGKVSSYQGETQLQVSKVTVIDNTINALQAVEVSTGNAMKPENTGKLIKTSGIVKNIVSDEKGVVGQIIVDDGTGPALIYINGYITKGTSLSFVKVGAKISVVGLASVGENFQSETDFLPRIRVRDRAEIVLVENEKPEEPKPEEPSTGGGSSHKKHNSSTDKTEESKVTNKADLSVKEMQKDSNASIKVNKDGIELNVSSKALFNNLSAKDKENKDISVSVKVNKLTEKQTKDLREKQAITQEFKDIKADIARIEMSMSNKNGVSRDLTALQSPMTVKMDLSKTEFKEDGKLTAVKYVTDTKGNVTLVKLGGEYDAKNKTFKFFANEPGDYSVVEAMHLSQVKLAVNDKLSYVNGKEVKNDVAPMLINERTMVPLRLIAENMGATVKWKNKTQTATIIMNNKELKMTMGKNIPGFDTQPVVINGRALVPIRYVADVFGCNVMWFVDTQEILIIK